jgi:DnaJ-class molecular chaperone
MKVASQMVKPHKNPNCNFCGGSGRNKKTGMSCFVCVCVKCNGTGYLFNEKKVCPRMELKKNITDSDTLGGYDPMLLALA